MTVPDPCRRQPRAAAVAAAAWSLAAVLAGCASAPLPTAPREALAAQSPAWVAAVPHGGSPAELQRWWQRFDDPLLPALIEQAQAGHPTVALAAARLTQARAGAAAAGAAGRPQLNAGVQLGRSRTESPPLAVVGTALNASLDASWELDLFGRVGASQRAAAARVESSAAQWHEARVSLAADVAATYLGLRTCEAVLAIYRDDASALTQIAGLTRKKVDAGFDAPASAALSEASAAEAAQRVVLQQAECDVGVKALVALTGQAEAPLRERLAAARGRLPMPAGFTPDPVPVRVLAQRPDLAAAERDLAAAAADVGAADADRWPRLSLSGSLGLGSLRSGGQTFDLQPWSIGAGLLAPLIDAGVRRAQADAARARYDEARAAWQSRAVGAVREVEEALVRLDAAARRDADAQRAAAGYAAFFQAAETQWRVGTGSLLDLEQARRSLLASRAALVQVQRDRVGAWLALYKAVGGGWQPDDPAPLAAAGLPPGSKP